MKYLCLVSVLVFGLWAGISAAEVVGDKPGAAKTVVAEEKTGSQLKEIDVGGETTAVEEEGYGVEERSQVSPGGTYDENTGLPNVVESDKTGELE